MLGAPGKTFPPKEKQGAIVAYRALELRTQEFINGGVGGGDLKYI